MILTIKNFFALLMGMPTYFLYSTTFLLAFPIVSSAQVSKVGVDQEWTTDREKLSISLNELKAIMPRDGIPPIYRPKFWNERVGKRKYHANEPAIVVSIRGIQKAYPLSVLLYHHIVNDRVAGVPLIITYCPLSDTPLVFDARLRHNDKNYVLTMGEAGMVRRSNITIWDHSTESWWQQYTGEALVGELKGAKLNPIPSQVLSVADFYKSYPYGLMLVKGFDRTVTYGESPYFKYDDIKREKPFLLSYFPDLPIPSMERVIACHALDQRFLYPHSTIAAKGVLNDTINDNYVTVFYKSGVFSILDQKKIEESREVGTMAAFSSFHQGKALLFKKEGEDFVDEGTMSRWDITGKCIEGKYKGDQLEVIQQVSSFAFLPFAFFPETKIYGLREDKL